MGTIQKISALTFDPGWINDKNIVAEVRALTKTLTDESGMPGMSNAGRKGSTITLKKTDGTTETFKGVRDVCECLDISSATFYKMKRGDIDSFEYEIESIDQTDCLFTPKRIVAINTNNDKIRVYDDLAKAAIATNTAKRWIRFYIKNKQTAQNGYQFYYEEDFLKEDVMS